jgi:hypothetical protein
MTLEESVVIDTIQSFNDTGRNKTFAEFLAVLFKDKFIEIYLGDSYEEVSTEQVSVSYPAVFCGKVVAAFKECLILNSTYVDKNEKKLKVGNLVFINERAIRGLTEIDGNGVMEDMFLRSRESVSVKEAFAKFQGK